MASDTTETLKETGQTYMFANEDGEVEPTFLKQYIAHYRHISEDDTRWREAYRYLPNNKEDLGNE